MNWYLKVLKQYADFGGRSRRKEYWFFFLFNMIFCVTAMILDRMLGLTFNLYGQSLGYGWLELRNKVANNRAQEWFWETLVERVCKSKKLGQHLK